MAPWVLSGVLMAALALEGMSADFKGCELILPKAGQEGLGELRGEAARICAKLAFRALRCHCNFFLARSEPFRAHPSRLRAVSREKGAHIAQD